MSATYGRLMSDTGRQAVSKSGRDYIEATAQTEHLRAVVTVWKSERIEIELRRTEDRSDRGTVVARMSYYPAGEVLDSDRPVLLIGPNAPDLIERRDA